MAERRGHDVGRPAKTGRPRALNDALQEQLCQYIEAGNYMETAAAACGITSRTVYEWLRRGHGYIEVHGEDQESWPPRDEDDEVDFARFARAVESANARAEAYAVLRVREAMPKQWQAAMTFLERRYPSRWRRRIAVDSDADGEADQRSREKAMLEDPEAVKLLHGALALAAAGELDDIIEEADVVEE